MEQKDLEVKIEENVLTLSGKRESEAEVKEDDFYRHERSFGTFMRSFVLPDTADHEHVDASYEKGVLTVKIPKKEMKPKDVKRIKVH
jgi:HSP20 family protein